MIDIKQIIIQEILIPATALKNKYTNERSATATWVCIFSQNDNEYHELLNQAKKLGNIFEETNNGSNILLNKPLGTVKILKIRKPDLTRPERGDADFTVSNYPTFKKECEGKDNFKVIQKDNFVMIEQTETNANVRVYFSNPPIEEQYKNIL